MADIKLVRYKKYNDTHLLFELLNAPQVTSINMDDTGKKSGKAASTSNVTFKGNCAKTPEDFEKAKPLIDRAYNEN
jgi:hypothetical protein